MVFSNRIPIPPAANDKSKGMPIDPMSDMLAPESIRP